MSTGNHERSLVSVPEAAMMLEISAPTLRRWIEAGVVPIIHPAGPGHIVRIRRDDVERLLEVKPKAAA